MANTSWGFNTVGLLEAILLDLDLRTLLLSQRVNRHSMSVIDGSRRVRQALFFELGGVEERTDTPHCCPHSFCHASNPAHEVVPCVINPMVPFVPNHRDHPPPDEQSSIIRVAVQLKDSQDRDPCTARCVAYWTKDVPGHYCPADIDSDVRPDGQEVVCIHFSWYDYDVEGF